ncbi:glycosyltransferase family 2 protein [Xanthomonas albilineans]|uniref:Putative glycosyltransferase protein n=1 Tax=Xanthomonas albilineans (strain GPE PC73 / CFBP 7063) TaxID=380358 RepID=D2UG18_XANAP|nr:glycosyltransferase family 2 protein [Xanthomonas albilineans]CBA17329.1 putative glycosyltransferase protein [Xanthomonas albilineans GPE PC73]
MADAAVTTLPLSLVVMTYNEAANIARCLDSVPFAGDKLVVDCGSTDDTVAIARAHGARVVEQAWLGFGPQRNFASTQAAYDWILVLDADEFLSDALRVECLARLPSLLRDNRVDAVWLRRSTWYMGAPMRWYKPMVGERLARLYHRGRARWREARVHESLRFDGASAEFAPPFHHLHNPTLVHKQLKVLRYAELKALGWRDKRKPVRMWQSPFVFVGAFLKDYLLRLACLDGWRGFIVAQTAASYALYKRMRYYEMQYNPASVEQARTQLQRHDLEH